MARVSGPWSVREKVNESPPNTTRSPWGTWCQTRNGARAGSHARGPFDVARGAALVAALAGDPARAPAQPGLGEDRADLEGGLVRRGHQHHVAAHHVAYRPGQEGIVGAAQQEGVDPRLP